MMHPLRSFALGLGLAALLSGAVSAREPEVDCADAVTQMEMTYCADQDYKKADAALNALWPEVAAKAKAFDAIQGTIYTDRGVPSSFEALRTAQRAWIEYRDRQCEYEAYEYFGGTLQPMTGLTCQWFRGLLTEQN